MRRIRIEQRVRRPREDENPPLPIDPRDPDVLRAKRGIDRQPKDRVRA